ncbi:MAG TPA: HAD-IA family hydrolase [Candidatus Sulfotelmatobacter sp.]|nr:HAD-IA family hydrolase [Candidatus Sulfotelmatobacter sp.]
MAAGAPVRLVVFDCDGTLVDSQHHIVAAMTAAFQAHGLADPAAAAVLALVGLPPAVMAAALLPALPDERHHAVADAYRQAFFAQRQHPGHREPLYPGAARVLHDLAAGGYLLGIATGKSRRGLDATLGAHGLLPHFATVQTADVARGKPDPEMLHRAMAEVGADPGETLLVGDTTYDMQMAANAGVRAIGVAWGYHAPGALLEAGAHCVIDDFASLAPLAATLIGGGPCV